MKYLIEYLNEEEIDEGIKYFKTSDRLKKEINRIQNKGKEQILKTPAGTKSLKFIKEQIIPKLEEMEKNYEQANTREEKKKIKTEYKRFVAQNAPAFSNATKILIKLGIVSSVVGAAGLLGYKIGWIPKLFSLIKGKFDSSFIQA